MINYRGDEREILNEITQSYLFKDIRPFVSGDKGAGFGIEDYG